MSKEKKLVDYIQEPHKTELLETYSKLKTLHAQIKVKPKEDSELNDVYTLSKSVITQQIDTLTAVIEMYGILYKKKIIP